MELDQNCIVVICAHSDDQIFGPGGTVAKYAKEGKKIFTIIFSYGEVYPFWLQAHHTIKARVKEALEVDRTIGGSGVVFFGMKESTFPSEWQRKKMYPKLKKILLKHKPYRIFTHSTDDAHHDHRIVNKIVLESLDKMKLKSEVYVFDIWTVFNLKKRMYPRVVIDISSTFSIKTKALRMFRSQGLSLFMLMWSVYAKAWFYGKSIGVKFAEGFYKMR